MSPRRAHALLRRGGPRSTWCSCSRPPAGQGRRPAAPSPPHLPAYPARHAAQAAGRICAEERAVVAPAVYPLVIRRWRSPGPCPARPSPPAPGGGVTYERRWHCSGSRRLPARHVFDAVCRRRPGRRLRAATDGGGRPRSAPFRRRLLRGADLTFCRPCPSRGPGCRRRRHEIVRKFDSPTGSVPAPHSYGESCTATDRMRSASDPVAASWAAVRPMLLPAATVAEPGCWSGSNGWTERNAIAPELPSSRDSVTGRAVGGRPAHFERPSGANRRTGRSSRRPEGPGTTLRPGTPLPRRRNGRTSPAAQSSASCRRTSSRASASTRHRRFIAAAPPPSPAARLRDLAASATPPSTGRVPSAAASGRQPPPQTLRRQRVVPSGVPPHPPTRLAPVSPATANSGSTPRRTSCLPESLARQGSRTAARCCHRHRPAIGQKDPCASASHRPACPLLSDKQHESDPDPARVLGVRCGSAAATRPRHERPAPPVSRRPPPPPAPLPRAARTRPPPTRPFDRAYYGTPCARAAGRGATGRQE